MLVDVSKGSEQLKINMEIKLKSIPCSIISMSIDDKVGSISHNQFNSILKQRINSNGQVIERNIPLTNAANSALTPESYEKVKESLIAKEGCVVSGFVIVNRVPGSLYLTPRPYAHYLSQFMREPNSTYYIDMSHTITHLSFGEKTDLEYIKTNFYNGTFNPLDGVTKADNHKNNIFQYYLNVVPTKYSDVRKKEFNANQFTANSNIVHEDAVFPALYFQYDMSPILVSYSLSHPSIFQAIVNVFAIFGGIFTIAGIIDSIMHRFTVKVSKKNW